MPKLLADTPDTNGHRANLQLSLDYGNAEM